MRKTLQKYAVLVVAVLLVIFLFQKINWLPSFNNIFGSKPVVIEATPVIITEINTLAQLITITFTDEVVMDTAKIGNGMPSLLPTSIGTILTPAVDKLVMIGRGKVLAGTDLKNLQEKDINVTDDSIHVSMPHAIILQTIINPSDFETFSEKGNWDESSITALKIKIRNEINRRAIQQNILQKADARSENIIETFLKNTGFKKVTIGFEN
ncbi:MAG: DUF4230 domain-containing protein [Ginsengibacter sp.]|jgi:hypothetical protein